MTTNQNDEYYEATAYPAIVFAELKDGKINQFVPFAFCLPAEDGGTDLHWTDMAYIQTPETWDDLGQTLMHIARICKTIAAHGGDLRKFSNGTDWKG